MSIQIDFKHMEFSATVKVRHWGGWWTFLYCTVLHCTVLFCTVLFCTVLHCTALYCTALYCTTLYCHLHCQCSVSVSAVHWTPRAFSLLYGRQEEAGEVGLKRGHWTEEFGIESSIWQTVWSMSQLPARGYMDISCWYWNHWTVITENYSVLYFYFTCHFVLQESL